MEGGTAPPAGHESRWTLAVQVLGAGAGIAAWVVVVGGARMWAKLQAIDVPADQTVSVLPRELLLTEGVRTLLVPLLLAGAIAVFAYLSRRADAEPSEPDAGDTDAARVAAARAVIARITRARAGLRSAQVKLGAARKFAGDVTSPEHGDESVASVQALRALLHDAQRGLLDAESDLRETAVFAHELSAECALESPPKKTGDKPGPSMADALGEAGRHAIVTANAVAAARTQLTRLTGRLDASLDRRGIGTSVGEILGKLPARDVEALVQELRRALGLATDGFKQMKAALEELGPILYLRLWYRRITRGPNPVAAVAAVAALVIGFTGIALAIVNADGIKMLKTAAAASALAILLVLLAWPWKRARPFLYALTLFALALGLLAIPIVGFWSALHFRYVVLVFVLTGLTIWFASGAMSRSRGAAATAWILFAAIAFWSGALAFITERGAKHRELETVVVRQKYPTPAVAGYYLGRTAKAVYLASIDDCGKASCRRVLSIPDKQVTCVIYGPSIPVEGNASTKVTTSLGYFNHPLSGDVCAAATPPPPGKTTPAAGSSPTYDRSKTTNSLALFNVPRIVFQRAPKQPAPSVSSIGPFAISLAGSSSPSPSPGGGRLVVGNALFKLGEWTLTPDAKANIRSAAREIRDAGARRVYVAGHADEKGTDAFNVRLALRRAATVETMLRKRLGNRVTIVRAGYGERLPLACNRRKDGSDNRKSRKLNRRVEIRTRRLMTYEPPTCGA